MTNTVEQQQQQQQQQPCTGACPAPAHSSSQMVLPPAAACRFFQDKRMKVSLFLAEGIQQPSSGKLVAPSCLSDQVGLVRSFDDTGKLEREERLQVNSQKVRRQHAAAGSSSESSRGSDFLCAGAGQQPG
jgi:hypothetical protein